MELMREVSFIFDVYHPNSEVFLISFEDNQSCISAAKSNKLSPRKKHIAIKYHNFRSFAQEKIIRICYIDTGEQTAYIFTRTLDEAIFLYLRIKLSGW